MKRPNNKYVLAITTIALLALAAKSGFPVSESANYEALVIWNAGSNSLTGNNYNMHGTIGQDLVDLTLLEMQSAHFGMFGIAQEVGEVSPEFKVHDLRAFSFATGQEIPEEAWQKYNELYFTWAVRPFDPATIVLGYSVGIDSTPDDTIDTTSAYYSTVGNNFITDGKHTFYVKAATSGDVWTEVERLEFWVDTTEPKADNLLPASGSLVSSGTPEVSCNLSDQLSGLNPDSIKVYIDGDSLEFTFEEGRLVAEPTYSLMDGSHTVRIQAEDMVGNLLNQIWGFNVDATAPVGSIVINGGDESTSYARVRLNIEATDQTTEVAQMMLANKIDFSDGSWQNFQSLITNWVLDEPQDIGVKTVYVLFKDEAGNISTIYEDEIVLLAPAIDTLISSGPYSPTMATTAEFSFQSTFQGAVFSFKIDDQDWSEWSASTVTSFSELSLGNHIFSVKSAKDMNGDEEITEDEEDPMPAQWTWSIQTEVEPEKGERILYWRTE